VVEIVTRPRSGSWQVATDLFEEPVELIEDAAELVASVQVPRKPVATRQEHDVLAATEVITDKAEDSRGQLVARVSFLLDGRLLEPSKIATPNDTPRGLAATAAGPRPLIRRLPRSTMAEAER
jgi:hypothetical protein